MVPHDADTLVARPVRRESVYSAGASSGTREPGVVAGWEMSRVESKGMGFSHALLILVAAVTVLAASLGSASAQGDAPADQVVEPLAPPADVTAQAVFVQDATAGVPLYALNADERRSPASTTKLMTALVIANNTTDWQELVTAEQVDVLDVSDGESMIGLLAGDVFTVEQMMYGLMLQLWK